MQTLELTNTVAAHQAASFHRYEVMHSEECGCFYCGAQFAQNQIAEWTDNGHTALCPKCHMDAVIPSSAQHPVTPELLENTNRYAF